MNKKKWLAVVLIAVAVIVISVTVTFINDPPDSWGGARDPETFAKESFVEVEGSAASVSVQNGLKKEQYPASDPTGAWLAGCHASDRDEQFDGYVLRHEDYEGDRTCFTFLIYLPIGESLQITPKVLAGENGYRVDIDLTPAATGGDYTLCRLAMELPTDVPPRLSFLLGDEYLDVLVTGTDEPIPALS